MAPPPPPPPPPEFAGKLCAWITEDSNTMVSCDDLTDPEQPLRCGSLRVFIHLQHSPPNDTPATAAEAAAAPAVWLGYMDTHIFTSSLFPARPDRPDRAEDIIGKEAYEAVWQSEAVRKDVTYDRELVRPTGFVYGWVQSVGSDGRTAYLRLNEEFVESEGFSRGRWSTLF